MVFKVTVTGTTLAQVAIIGFFLGIIFAISAYLMLWGLLGNAPDYALPVGVYIFCTIPMFHMTEFIVAVLHRPHDAKPQSFMIFHSPAFLFAVGSSWIELLLAVSGVIQQGSWLRPVPFSGKVALMGGIMSVSAYSVRAISMVQCSSHFALQIEDEKRPEHKLVTHGLYSVLRHPSYFGWFWHITATQLIVGNTFCTIGFALVTWLFFRARIRSEEAILQSEDFFGEQYTVYKQRTIIGIPLL